MTLAVLDREYDRRLKEECKVMQMPYNNFLSSTLSGEMQLDIHGLADAAHAGIDAHYVLTGKRKPALCADF